MFKATQTKSILTMASVPCSPMKNTTLCRIKLNPLMCLSSFSLQEPRASHHFNKERFIRGRISIRESSSFGRNRKEEYGMVRKEVSSIPRSNISSNSDGSGDESSNQAKTPFGYTRKDVLLIGLGVTLLGVGLKSGLEFVGVNELVAGNVVQLVLVLGLTVGWISTYVFRVGNKEMTYAQQLRDYESKVMEKRLESLTEAELQVLIEQVEEEKRILGKGD